MAVRLAGATEREITLERKGNRISEHNKAATPQKMTREAHAHLSEGVCASGIYFKGKKDCDTYNYRLSFCLLTLVAKWRAYIVSYCLKKMRGGGAQSNSSCPWVWRGAGHSGSVLHESHGSDGSHQFATKNPTCLPSSSITCSPCFSKPPVHHHETEESRTRPSTGPPLIFSSSALRVFLNLILFATFHFQQTMFFVRMSS